MEKTLKLQKLTATLAAYRKQFLTATPLERSVLLMAMQGLMSELETLSPKRKPVYQKFSWEKPQAA